MDPGRDMIFNMPNILPARIDSNRLRFDVEQGVCEPIVVMMSEHLSRLH